MKHNSYMAYFAVCGKPISHSKSPIIQNSFFAANSYKAGYSRLVGRDFASIMRLFSEMEISGMNITSPFKEVAMQYCDDIDEVAKQIGAINTIIKTPASTKGYNTDYLGVLESLSSFDLANKNILILGAGNAAKAVLFALQEYNKNILIINRTYSKAEVLAEEFGCKCANWESLPQAISTTDVLINTINADIELCHFIAKPNLLILDAIYHNSKIQTWVEQLNRDPLNSITYLSGMHWLINQAVPAARLFMNNAKAECSTADLPNLLNAERKVSRVYLIGFMASGKSSVGRELARVMNWQFIDLDEEIARREGESIKSIFASKGEDYFRKVESDVLYSISAEKAIIACGGGTLASEANREFIKRDSLVIYLWASFDLIAKWLTLSSERPLYNSLQLDELKALFDSRRDSYFSASDLIVSSDDTIENVANLLAEELRQLIGRAESFELLVPESKSELQREIAINTIFPNGRTISFTSLCDDTLSAIRMSSQLSVVAYSHSLISHLRYIDTSIYSDANRAFISRIVNDNVSIFNSYDLAISINKLKDEFPDILNAGESGLAMNLYAGIVALRDKPITIEADGTLRNRKQSTLIKVLESIGKRVQSNDEKPPLNISEGISNYELNLGVLESSQAVSAILLTFAKLMADNKIERASLKAERIKSIKYAYMTAKQLQNYGLNVHYEGSNFTLTKGEASDKTKVAKIGCWSSASFWFALAALRDKRIHIKNLDTDSLQADKAIIDIIALAGGVVKYEDEAYKMVELASRAFEFDATDAPDLIPNLIVFASQLDGTSIIRGAKRLLNKESNRAEAIISEIGKLNINVKWQEDTFIVENSQIIPCHIDYRKDHRIEMAAALAFALAGRPFSRGYWQFSVAKSYPNFYNDLLNYQDFIT